ncbi:hypothetical protein evm_011831 [Chilo suppressalis]|nr:hypothetical protein evm_011831 [Chilo suppressalis]
MSYSLSQYAEMHYYGVAQGNGIERHWEPRRNNGALPGSQGCGSSRSSLARNSKRSVYKFEEITRLTGIPRTTVFRILKEEGDHAYHIQRVQQLQELGLCSG